MRTLVCDSQMQAHRSGCCQEGGALSITACAAWYCLRCTKGLASDSVSGSAFTSVAAGVELLSSLQAQVSSAGLVHPIIDVLCAPLLISYQCPRVPQCRRSARSCPAVQQAITQAVAGKHCIPGEPAVGGRAAAVQRLLLELVQDRGHQRARRGRDGDEHGGRVAEGPPQRRLAGQAAAQRAAEALQGSVGETRCCVTVSGPHLAPKDQIPRSLRLGEASDALCT